MSLNAKQTEALNLIQEGKNVFITGAGGCGKTYLINYLKTHLSVKVAITALTGKAASIIHGQTLHSWGGISRTQNSKEHLLKQILKSNDLVTRWKTTDILVIDEVSMLSIELFHRLNYLGQQIREDSRFFGGLQVVFSGDFCQLPPVGPTDRFCFESTLWKKHITNIVYLREIIRQSDPELQQVLNEIRLGIITSKTKQLLNSRLIEFNETDEFMEIKPTILYPYNMEVDQLNQQELQKLITDFNQIAHTFQSIDTYCDWKNQDRVLKNSEKKEITQLLTQGCPGEKTVNYCVGAQVMLISNLDISRGLVNGARGVIIDFVPSTDEFNMHPVVKFHNGIECTISPYRWNIDHPKYTINRIQFPLILAWSISVHKSQGSTLSLVMTDLKNVFAPGQAYVALSRIERLQGLYIQGIAYSKIKCHPKVKKFYEDLEKLC